MILTTTEVVSSYYTWTGVDAVDCLEATKGARYASKVFPVRTVAAMYTVQIEFVEGRPCRSDGGISAFPAI